MEAFVSVNHSALLAAPFLVAKQALMAHYHIDGEDAPLADVDAVLAPVDGSAHEIVSGFTQPAVPRNITATAGGTAASIKAIQVIVEGIDFDGLFITETLPAFTVDTPGTVVGNKAFKAVTKVTIPAHDATNATTSIGHGSKLGIPNKLPYNTIDRAYVNNTLEGTAPTVTVSSSAVSGNTAQMNTALDGTKPVDLFYYVP